MFYLIYIILFLIYCVLPVWLQLILFVVAIFVAPGGNIIMLVGIVIGFFIKAKMKN